MIWLIGLHLVGVIKHQFIDRDNILARMTGRG
jgi:cytochrome b561